MIVASVPVEVLLGDAVTGTATKGPIETLVSARMRGARPRDRLGHAMLAQPRAAAIKVMRKGG
jgi:hypothetical protein